MTVSDACFLSCLVGIVVGFVTSHAIQWWRGVVAGIAIGILSGKGCEFIEGLVRQ